MGIVLEGGEGGFGNWMQGVRGGVGGTKCLGEGRISEH